MDKSKMFMYAGAGVVAVSLAIGIAFFAGRGCTPNPVVPPVTTIDAGPGDQVIADRLDARVQVDEAAILAAEQKHAADLAALTAEQQHEYTQIREQGPDAVSAYLRQINEGLRDGGVS